MERVGKGNDERKRTEEGEGRENEGTERACPSDEKSFLRPLLLVAPTKIRCDHKGLKNDYQASGRSDSSSLSMS